ncbi:MAG: permease [Dinoroseobacter sp.]|uniref:permease n=1 Tax=Alterinioella nitratireducens TaxID=2735915 RepID=UPI000C8BC352|nr:permease [Dinoroseobacter sp.]NPD18434.1 permease [Alterinioella nitratireducens]
MTDLSQSAAPLRRPFARIDKVLLTCVGIAIALLLLDRAAFWPSITEAATSLAQTGPFILFAVAAIGVMRATGSERLMEGAFEGRETRMIVLGALAGGLSPFCSCEVIPFIAALLAAGAPLSAVMAFWLASPLMDPAMFAITAGALGTDFAIAKTIGAVAIGLMGGFAMMALSGTALLANPLKARTPSGCGSCCGGEAARPTLKWAFWQDAPRRRVFAEAAWANLLFLGKWLLLAYLLQALLIRYIPAEWIGTTLGGDGIGPILLGALLGAPAYLNGYAAVPLIEGLVAQGMSQGAAMSFVIAGGVSSIPAAVAVWALVKPKIFLSYLGLAITGAILAGLTWGAIA